MDRPPTRTHAAHAHAVARDAYDGAGIDGENWVNPQTGNSGAYSRHCEDCGVRLSRERSPGGRTLGARRCDRCLDRRAEWPEPPGSRDPGRWIICTAYGCRRPASSALGVVLCLLHHVISIQERKERYWEHVEAGLCADCGARPPASGGVTMRGEHVPYSRCRRCLVSRRRAKVAQRARAAQTAQHIEDAEAVARMLGLDEPPLR